MPSVSDEQKRFFQVVRAVQNGKMKKKDVSKSVRKAAKSMTKKQVADFADHISESVDNNFVYGFQEDYDEFSLLDEFINDKGNGVKRIQFELIPAAQYKNLLKRFMSAPNPQMARIPDKIVDKWLEMTARNFIKIVYITEFAGHSSYFPGEYCEDMFGEDDGVNWSNYYEASEKLDEIGFYEWCKLPDGSDGWSDYGIEPIYKIFSEYDVNMEGYEKLMLLNRILDVGHCRGDLASAFIEGGSKTCSEISGIEESFNVCGKIMSFDEFCKSKGN